MLYPDLFPLHVVFMLVMGALFGSLFNVCIYRIPTGQKLTVPGSYCYSCGTHVRWYDNLPVLSYLLLRGRCRTCRAPFSMRYAMIEVLTGCLFLAVFLKFNFCWALPTYYVFTGLLLIATFTDFDHWIIPDRISWGGGLMGIGFAFALAFIEPVDVDKWVVAHAGPAPGDLWWGPAANSLAGAAAGALVLWTIGIIGSIVFRTPAMGFGDTKLLFLIGAFCGWKIALLCIFLASLFGSIQGLFILTSHLFEKKAAPSPKREDSSGKVEELKEILDDDSEAASERGWTFPESEKNVLMRLLTAPAEPPRRRRHVKFGPHLALAAWLLLLFEQPVLAWIVRIYLPSY